MDDWVVVRAADANNAAPPSRVPAAAIAGHVAPALEPPLFAATRPHASEALRVGFCEYLRYNKLLQAMHLLHLPHA